MPNRDSSVAKAVALKRAFHVARYYYQLARLERIERENHLHPPKHLSR